MAQKYCILRVLDEQSIKSPGATTFSARLSRSMIASHREGPPEARMDVEDITFKDLRNLSRDPEVLAVAPSRPTKLIKPFDVPATAEAKSAWGIQAVGASTSSLDGDGVVVAVLDTGIDDSHPAFAGVTLQQNDLSGSGLGDRVGHGTHCAGTIFGHDVGGVRIGIARNVKSALIGKVLDDNGHGQSDWIFRGIHWAISMRADVISMSLGFDFPGMVADLIADGWPSEMAAAAGLDAYRLNLRMFDALMAVARASAAFSGGSVVVAAAGNESKRETNPQFELPVALPGVAEGVFSVGALEQQAAGLRVADFSNTLPDISAPGVSVLSARPGGGLVTLSGTSMATPHVAGVAALWWQALRGQSVPASATMVLAKLRANARADVFVPGVDVADRGAGLVMAPVT